MLQCHLAVPVRAGQELPRRRQEAHPRRGGATLLGISTAARAASAVSSSSIAVGVGGRRPFAVSLLQHLHPARLNGMSAANLIIQVMSKSTEV